MLFRFYHRFVSVNRTYEAVLHFTCSDMLLIASAILSSEPSMYFFVLASVSTLSLNSFCLCSNNAPFAFIALSSSSVAVSFALFPSGNEVISLDRISMWSSPVFCVSAIFALVSCSRFFTFLFPTSLITIAIMAPDMIGAYCSPTFGVNSFTNNIMKKVMMLFMAEALLINISI
ncbi:Uncharacterised protein [Klebsiella pneumoniae]|nr:Uncharacterised protein [Klebsiella pneumoniae]